MRVLVLAALVATCFAADKVDVVFYGESLCPFCKEAMGGPVNKTLTAQGLLDIMNFDYVPWGNAFFITTECGGKKGHYDASIRTCWDAKCGVAVAPSDCYSGDIVCQHGDGECTGNIVQNCVKNQTANDAGKYMPFMYCMEYLGQPAESCAKAAGFDYAKVQECASGTLADRLLVEAARKTALIPGGHPGVPYITVNGNAVTDTNLLLLTVCASYKGTKPPGCSQ